MIRRPDVLGAAARGLAAAMMLACAANAQNAPDTQKTGSAPASTPSGTSSSRPEAERPEWFPKGPLGLKWVSIGVFVPVATQAEIPGASTTSGTTLPITKYTTSGQTSRASVGLALEFPIFRHVTAVGEGIFHHLGYQDVHEVDTADPSAGSNIVTTWTENTHAREWEIPAMLRYTGFTSRGVLSKVYVEGGADFRRIAHVQTTTAYDQAVPGQADNTSSSNTPAIPAATRMRGTVAAVGFRFLDDFNIRVTPEVRYIRWPGPVFAADTTRSRDREIQVGVGITF